MSLALGTRLGFYEVLAPLGAGGMGEVYRARDTRLDRCVAIKILPPHFSCDPIHKQRFEREAKTISGLNHPNICTLHDVGSQNGIDYLVMECVEGESLSQRLEKGPLPTEQVLKVGHEIADALTLAHRRGIIHRDLKPGNIMLTKSGAKLLDFGLARPASRAISLTTLTDTSSQRISVTQEGAIVGTFQYMSPEQVEGRELDARSDIFSFGAVLYEMITGEKAFQGKSQLSVASAILEKEPAPISTIKPVSPRSLDYIVRRCLAKDSDDRWQTAHDLSLALGCVTDDSSWPSSTPTRQKRRELIAWCFAILAMLTSVALLLHSSSRSSADIASVRSSILAPDNTDFSWMGSVAMAPNGKSLVFSASQPGRAAQLWMRNLDSLTQKPIPGTEGAENPFWSPDSRWVAFSLGGKLMKVPHDGGPPLEICQAGNSRGGTWGPDGTILFVPGMGFPVYSVSANGGSPQPITQLDKSLSEVTHRWPQFLPDGKHFLFFSWGPENTIYAGSLGSRERKLILKNKTNAVYASGFLLFQRNGTLMAQPFDTAHLELTGTPMPIADEVATRQQWQHALFSVSDTGLLAYQSRSDQLLEPMWVDRSGAVLESVGDPTHIRNSAVSPDGQKIAFAINDPEEDTTNIWLYGLHRGLKTRLTFEPIGAQQPVWSPDSSRLFYSSNRSGRGEIFSVSSSGVRQAEQVVSSDGSIGPCSWSPDGRYLVLMRIPAAEQGRPSLWVFENFGEKTLRPLFSDSHSSEWDAVFSRDGDWLAYESSESGVAGLYIVPFPSADTRIQVATGVIASPRWSNDGKELFYLSDDGTIRIALLKHENNSLKITSTVALFKTQGPAFDISPDGKRIMIFKNAEAVRQPSITLVTNWPSLLRQQ